MIGSRTYDRKIYPFLNCIMGLKIGITNSLLFILCAGEMPGKKESSRVGR
uniref:Uncharacterized protein n=1 Tax=Picea glauca TaxID=3330 RepID=A0A101LW18_PICGL|nr:hypothetical protein ABT39_MTgene1508 [Picea glauca]